MSTEGHSTVDIKDCNRAHFEKKALETARVCIQRAIEAMPAGEGSEAYINMNNVMRQLGCDKQAHELTWMQVKQAFNRDPKNSGVDFIDPVPLDCSSLESTEEMTIKPKDGPLNVVCVKYGTKYGADYVNKLYWGVKKHLSLPHTFSCFTEDAKGLDENILVKPLKHTWGGWWSKVHIFDPSVYPDENTSDWVFYIDLDMIITGSL